MNSGVRPNWTISTSPATRRSNSQNPAEAARQLPIAQKSRFTGLLQGSSSNHSNDVGYAEMERASLFNPIAGDHV